MPMTLLRHAAQKPFLGPQKLDLGNTLVYKLQGFWLINEGAGPLLFDASGNNRSIPPFNASSAQGWTSTKDGTAIQGNGSNVVWSLPNASAYYAGGPVTLWARAITLQNGNNQYLIGFRQTNNNLYMLHLSGGLNYEARYTGADGNNHDANIALPADGLHTLALVYDGANISTWVDGTQKVSTGGTSNTTATNGALELLRTEQSGQGQSSNETLIACALWSRALTSAEHHHLATDPYALFQTKPVQRWPVIAAAAGLPPGLGPSMDMDPGQQSALSAMMR